MTSLAGRATLSREHHAGGHVIIWGTRSSSRTLAVLALECRGGHTAAHRVVERTLRFALFFVPLFPISRTRSVDCTGCGARQQLTKEQAAHLFAQVTAPTAAGVPPAAAAGT